MNDCIFCRIVKERRVCDEVVFEDDLVIALISLHQKPSNLGHAILLPKAHVETIYELPSELDAALMASLRRLAKAVRYAFSANGIQIRQNNGAAADQDVFHLHFHVIPRFQNDGFESARYELLSTEKMGALTRQLQSDL